MPSMGNDVDEKAWRLNGRARLALRAERAIGANAIPASAYRGKGEGVVAGLPAEVHAPDGPAPLPPGANATLATRPEAGAAPSDRSGGSGLFGSDSDPAAGQVFTAPSVPFESAPLETDEKRLRLVQLDENEVRGCTRCRLCQTRTHTVFGEGSPDAPVFFIGEGPGENEDLSGRPFVGKAGQLLDKQIAAMGLKREQVYIANVVKCRPPGNREPSPDEVATCTPYLQRQLEIVRPKVIVTLGRPATQHMLQSKLTMSRMRGQWHEWRGIKLMPTFHPAYLLRSYTRENREMVWSDLQQVMGELGLAVASRRGG
jgi:DNA polymerase